jgi:hypothetical protein
MYDVFMFSFYWLGLKKILSIAKKIFLVILVYFIVVSLFFHFIKKDRPTASVDLAEKNRQEIYKLINDPQLNKTQEGIIVIGVYRTMLCATIGEACTNNPADAEKNFHHSIFGFLTNLIVLPYTNPPSSGVYWAYSGLQNAGFIPKTYAAAGPRTPVYAQGIGFAAIKPFMSVWKVFRDLSYMLVVLVLIAIGFMIMFRAKLNPQTVISVENSLPKIVVALLLITFSFAIAGFLIDLMYISVGIIAVLFSNAPNIPADYDTPQKILEKFYFSDLGGILGFLFDPGNTWKLSWAIFGILPRFIRELLTLITVLVFPPHRILSILYTVIAGGNVSPAMVSVKNFIERLHIFGKNLHSAGSGTPVLSVIVGVIFLIIEIFIYDFVIRFAGTVILFLLLFISLFYLFFRIFFTLLYAYIQIILLIFFAPVILMVEMIPGKSTFSSWIKNLTVNLITWPLLVIFLLISQILLNQPSDTNSLWSPPFLIGINPDYIKIIISMGILYMIPDLIKIFKELIGVKPLPLGLNLGAFTAGAGAVIGGGAGALGQFYTPYQFLFGQGGLAKKIFGPKSDGGNVSNETRTTGQGGGGVSGTSPPS